MPLAVDSLLNNRYRIKKIIAQGGMGAIYRAHDETLDVEVAVKENLITSQESSRQFHREATILAGMRHPNMPRVTDHFVIPDQGQYLVMDFISGEDLRQRIDRKGPLAESEAVLIITAACDALTYLHTSQPPIVHRDIKPGNIKVTPDGQVFLVDFGLAKISQAGKATTLGAQALTPGYAPPEQYGRGTDSRSDLYSLGATLYAALTGKTPEDSLARATGSRRLTPLREYNPNISVSLAAVIEKAMNIDPNQRYQTAESFKAALLEANTSARRTLEETRHVRVSPAPPSQPPLTPTVHAAAGTAAESLAPAPPAPRPAAGAPPAVIAKPAPAPARKMPWVAIAAVIVVLIAGGAVTAVLLIGRGQKSSPAPSTTPLPVIAATSTTAPMATIVQPTETSLPEPTAVIDSIATETPPPLPSATFTPAVTPMGGPNGELAFASDRSGIPQVYIWQNTNVEPRQLTNFPDGACQPDWSPDGNRIIFISPCPADQDEYQNGSMFILNADGSGLVRLDTQPGGDFAPAWSPDGASIAFSSLRDPILHIFLYDLATNKVTRISPPSSRDSHPDWSPDGSKLVFDTTRSGEMQVWTMNLDSSSPREFSTAGGSGESMPVWSPDGKQIAYISGSSRPILAIRAFGEAGAQERQISSAQPAWKPSISPDSRLIAYQGLLADRPAIFIIEMDSGTQLAVISSIGADFDPAWKP